MPTYLLPTNLVCMLMLACLTFYCIALHRINSNLLELHFLIELYIGFELVSNVNVFDRFTKMYTWVGCIELKKKHWQWTITKEIKFNEWKMLIYNAHLYSLQNVIQFKLCVWVCIWVCICILFRRTVWQTFLFNYLIYLHNDFNSLDLLVKTVFVMFRKFCYLVIISTNTKLTNNNM